MAKSSGILAIATVYFLLLINNGVFASESNETSVTSTTVVNNVTVSDNSTASNSSEPEKPKHPRIVIIGAGASGVAAAAKLFEAGFKNVTIIEAEERIGGRIHTTEFGGYLVDCGAQWVHGVKNNVAYELAAPLGLLDTTDKPIFGISQKFFESDGDLLDEETGKTLMSFYFKYSMEDDGPDNITAYKSLGDYIEKMFDKTFQNDSKIYKDKKKYIDHFEVFRNSLESAESWHNISLEDGGYEECEGDQMANWKTLGYSTILQILMKKLPDKGKELPVEKSVILNSTVLAIDYIGDSEGPPVLVTTTNGQLYKADHVIVTVSLGVLKEKHKSLFIPPLPDDKVKTIENLGFGSVTKIFLAFDKPFWTLGDSRTLYFNFIWNDDDRQAVQNDTNREWLLGMSSAHTVEHKPNLLELWVTGKAAKAVELLPDEAVFNHTRENLHRFLGKKLKITEPLAMKRSMWYSNPHFRGTYSYRSVDSQKEKVYPEMLEKPINHENLTVLFAGEATSEKRFSTVDGAIGSGWKAANRLIDHYKDKLPFDY